jgi:glycine/D-amino acid oxidase-like deaminating enzyme
MFVPDRRQFLISASAGGALAALSGCATVGGQPRTLAGCGPLPPVKVARDRIIRSLVGLRPYRDAGFVVRAEAFAAKRLVHNYGHGGAGITLSWGTSRLATDLGLPGHIGDVAVLGSGIVGLTTARLVQEAGFPVTIYTAALPPETTSNIAGGEFSPSLHFDRDSVTPEWREQFRAALAYAYRRYQIMVGDEYGVRWLDKYSFSDSLLRPPDPLTASIHPDTQDLEPGQHPFGNRYARHRKGMYIQTPKFLDQLLEDIRLAGGKVVVRKMATAADVAALPESLVFNCTGLGSRELFGDTQLRPGRGQVELLLPQAEVQYAYAEDVGYMFPRADGIVLGGTFDLDNWSTIPDPAVTARIISHHQQLTAGFRCLA